MFLGRNWVNHNLASLEESLTIIDDRDDANYFVAVRYSVMKATWIELNTYLNYLMVNKGTSDESKFELAGTVSHLLALYEPHVEPLAIEKIRELLSNPMNNF